MARGIVDRLDRWENDLLARYYPFEHKKGVTGALQLGVRPIRLYEIAFPEPCLNTVLELMQPMPDMWNKGYMKYLFMVKKILGLESLPKIPPPSNTNALYRNFVQCTGIGIKRDRYEEGIELI